MITSRDKLVRKCCRIGLAIVVTMQIMLLVNVFSPSAKGADGNCRKIEKPYSNHHNKDIPFGCRSYELQPWKAYMDTRPARAVPDCFGVNFNLHVKDTKKVEQTARMLAMAGVSAARVEIGWNGFSYDNPSEFHSPVLKKHLQTVLTALKKYGIRPLILLNSNSGMPCPAKRITVELLKDAGVGAREIYVKNTESIITGYTGLQRQAYQTAFPLVMKTGKDGRCLLSAPLKKAVRAGKLELLILKYAPFAEGAVLADGTAWPSAQETMKGWVEYVKNTCRFVEEALGTGQGHDSGFDVEIWNEYSFGTQHFLGMYYEPKLEFREPLTYARGKFSVTGREIILPLAVDYITKNHKGVRVISGLSNQRPFDNGADMWQGQHGISRHYYATIEPGNWNSLTGFLSPETEVEGYKKQDIVNADNKHESYPYFIPTTRLNLPEVWSLGIKTEFMVRDIQPMPGPFRKHYRFSTNPEGEYARVWMTEYNFARDKWSKYLRETEKVDKKDSDFQRLMEYMAAKSLLRSVVFYSNKGVETICFFAVNWPIDSLGLVPESFYDKISNVQNLDDDELMATAGKQMQVMQRLCRLMKSGEHIENPRPLAVESIIEKEPEIQIKGNGTSAHPDQYFGDYVAVLPFQLAADSYAIGCYVMTTDMIRDWDENLPVLDPRRYAMPRKNFIIKLSNIAGANAQVSLWDPMTDESLEVNVVEAGLNYISVELPLSDYPCILQIKENKKGVLVLNPQISMENKRSHLSFAANIDSRAKVSWGKLPDRTSGGSKILKVNAGETAEVSVNNLSRKDGFKIVAIANNLRAVWPQHDYDTLGRIGIKSNQKVSVDYQNEKSESGILKTITELKNYGNFTVTHPEKITLNDIRNSPKILQLGGLSATITFAFHSLPPEKAEQLIPEHSTSDAINSRVVTVGQQSAWLLEIIYDLMAHPGMKMPKETILILPLREGLLTVSLRSTEESYPQAVEQFKDVIKSMELEK